MIMRVEQLIERDGEWVAFSASDIANMGGWLDVETATGELMKRGAHEGRVRLACGGYESTVPHPELGFITRVTFWPEAA